MDPTTAVVLMTLNLAVTGTLVALIASGLEGQRPLRYCAASTGVFAAAYAVRLSLGIDTQSPWAIVPDTAMVVGGTLFLRGQRLYLRHGQGGLGPVLAVGAAFALVHFTLTSLAGQAARHASLNTALGLLYLGMAFTAWQGWRHLPAAERAAQRLMVLTASVLGVATIARAIDSGVRGVDTLFVGPTAQAYYALSSICILLMGPSMLLWLFSRLNGQLQELATHDPLTGALNRNGLVQSVRRHFAARSATPMVWLMIDIDRFKRVNDTLGHGVGDRLLQAVARAVMDHVRAEDFVARLGGEEFLVGVVGPPPGQAEALAERLRAAVAGLSLPLGAAAEPLRCTVSLGVSRGFAQLDDWEAALRGADEALYAAKSGGRNRVVAAG
jgi:diguanylate cyclase (GGDEF)-like protein